MSKFVYWWVFCFVLADILWVWKFENPARVSRRALGAPLRAPFGASRLTPPSAPPLGPGGTPERDFQIFKLTKYQLKKQNITKNEFIIQRKHRYPYNKFLIFHKTDKAEIANFIDQVVIKFIEKLKLMTVNWYSYKNR